jgi:hypothetical protein
MKSSITTPFSLALRAARPYYSFRGWTGDKERGLPGESHEEMEEEKRKKP